MKPAPFAYHRPITVDEALALLAKHGGEAKPLAGGQSLIPAMNFRLARPAVLVDLNRIVARGFSMGGAACWQFAVHYAGRFAAAAPGAGFSETPDFLRVFQDEQLTPAGHRVAAGSA